MTHLRDNVFYTLFEHKEVQRRRYWVKTKCAICKKEMFANYANFLKSSRSFCSKKCQTEGYTGPNSPSWKGGRLYKRGNKQKGHIKVYAPQHPFARKGYVAEHRLVVEKAIGRILTASEFVHHINCNQEDNRLENLDICDKFQHNLAHSSIEKCVPTLFELGVLGYDCEKKCYFVKASVKGIETPLTPPGLSDKALVV